MAIEIGNYITPELKEYINTFVDPSERKTLLRNYGFSGVLERMVLGGEKPITVNTHEYFIQLVKIAVKNRTKKLPQLNQVHKELKEIT